MKHSSQKLQSAAAVLTKMLVVMCVVGIAGCGNSDISKVKAMKLDADPSYTVGQAFDNRKVCDSVKWDTITDQRGRKLVEYRCSFKGVQPNQDLQHYVKVGEVFQWSMDDDGTPTLAYAGYELTYQNGQVDNQSADIDRTMQVILRDTATSFIDYNQQYMLVSG